MPPDSTDIASSKAADRPAFARSAITNGSSLLPNIDGRSLWARLLRDTVQALESHCGGELTEVERMTARRAAALEVELVHLEAEFARIRGEGRAPDATMLDLYSRLAGGQRRHLEALGMQRKPRDLVPDPLEYARGKAA